MSNKDIQINQKLVVMILNGSNFPKKSNYKF